MASLSSIDKDAKKYRLCSRCVMDTSDPYIDFNAHGHCNHCSEFLANTKARTYSPETSPQQLKSLVERVKQRGKGSKYDCVLGLSGGIDSCYAAVEAKRLGLRVLCVHMDNGWNADEAVSNIRNVVKRLNFDYESFVLNWKEFREIQLAVLKSGIVEVEIPTDIAILGALHRVASKHNVKYILSGGNFSTEGILPDSWFYDPKDLKLLKSITRLFGKAKLRNFPSFDFKEEIYYKFVRGIRMLYLLNYVPYDKLAAKTYLENEMGWKYYGGKHYESRFTGFVQSYYQFEKFNVDYRRATLSTMICMGEISREEALKELQNKPYSLQKIKEDKIYISKKLGISIDEFESIMAAPAKSYRDYPNNEVLLKKLYSIYRRFLAG